MNSIPFRDAGPRVSRQLWLLLPLTALAILVHGYHPLVEDAEIYVPGIKKLLSPALYPMNQGFFASHAGMTFYPNLIAWSVRLTHLSLEWVLFLWHFACIFALLAGCWKLGTLYFGSTRAAWGGTLLVAGLLTIPVAGTALYIMDQYLNPRSFSTATAVWIVASALEKKYLRAAIWILLTAVVHPLMAVFSLGFVVMLAVEARMQSPRALAAVIVPATLFPPVTPAYLRALRAHSYFFILRWEWYEWLGIFGAMAIFWGFGVWAKRRRLWDLRGLCMTTIAFCLLCLIAALAVTIPPPLVRFAELQPLRGLLLAFVFLFVVGGGLLAEYVLQGKLLRWAALFVPIGVGMFYAQRQLFPATHHLELPGRKPASAWVQTFLWIKDNTPLDAYFALDPGHMLAPGEDQHGFRAVAERSMLADAVKDSGAVTMFPALAQTWEEQVDAQHGWKDFHLQNFEALHEQFGVNWFVLKLAQTGGMECPYKDSDLYVCHLPSPMAKGQ